MNKKIYYARAVYNNKEISASLNVLKNNSLTLMDGKNVKKFENKIAKLFGKKFALMVNSGSSANLLALASLNLKKNDEVITPTLTFSTTVSPIYQLGLIPKFIDIEKNTYVADIKKLFKAINKKTGARGLRSIIEALLLKTMFKLPAMDDVEEVRINESIVKNNGEPLIIHSKTKKTTAA